MYMVKIDLDKCKGCGECVDICPSEVLEMADEKANVANPDECAGCESCVEVCEEGAITVTEM
jgi:NAD-dependent dihydropyrimidine dehydrogenase PreA subunit